MNRPAPLWKEGHGGPQRNGLDRFSPLSMAFYRCGSPAIPRVRAAAPLSSSKDPAGVRRCTAPSCPLLSVSDGCRTATPRHVSSHLTSSWDWLYGTAPPILIPLTSIDVVICKSPYTFPGVPAILNAAALGWSHSSEGIFIAKSPKDCQNKCSYLRQIYWIASKDHTGRSQHYSQDHGKY